MYRWIAILIWTALLVALPKLAYDDWKVVATTLEQPAMVRKEVTTLLLPANNNRQVSHETLSKLFGIVAAKPKSMVKPVEELPTTRLNLQLAGTFTHKSHPRASALIAHNGKPSKRYYGGETVAGSAELVKITKRSVVLRRNGRDEILLFPRISPVKEDTGESSQSVATEKVSRDTENQASNQLADNFDSPQLP